MNEIASFYLIADQHCTIRSEVMSLVKIFSGRKRGSAVWQYFTYDDSKRRSTCIIAKDNGRQCGMLVATKNPTNLKNHLRHHHHTEYEELEKAESEKSGEKAKRLKTETGTFKCYKKTIHFSSAVKQ